MTQAKDDNSLNKVRFVIYSPTSAFLIYTFIVGSTICFTWFRNNTIEFEYLKGMLSGRIVKPVI